MLTLIKELELIVNTASDEQHLKNALQELIKAI